MRFLLLLPFLYACSQAPVRPADKKLPQISPYPRIEADIQRICWATQELDGYENRYIFDCRKGYSPSTRMFAGYGFRSKIRHPHTSHAKSPYRGGKVKRSIDMISRNKALNETYLHVIDFAGGPDSHDPKSFIYLFPRVEIPSITEGANQIELTLPTGEMVYFDASTGEITGGALEEGPVDTNRNYRNRRPPNVNYTGDYISVRLTHSYEDPAVSANTAVVRQKDNVCRLPRTTLFSRDGKLLTRSDAEFLEVINTECSEKFWF